MPMQGLGQIKGFFFRERPGKSLHLVSKGGGRLTLLQLVASFLE